MLMLMGPHTALGNIPRSIEYSVDWVTGLLRFCEREHLTRLEATTEGVGVLDRSRQGRWAWGCSPRGQFLDDRINSNVEGKQTRIIARYSGSAPAYRARCDEVRGAGYAEFEAG